MGRKRKDGNGGGSGYSVEEAVRLYKQIRPDYEYVPRAIEGESNRAQLLKWVCSNRLETGEKALVYLYAELGSITDLAQMLRVGRSTLGDELLRIKRKIKDEMAKLWKG